MRMVDAPVDTEKKVNRLEDLPPDLGCTVTYSAMNAYACMTSRGPLSSGRPSPRRSQRYAPTERPMCIIISKTDALKREITAAKSLAACQTARQMVASTRSPRTRTRFRAKLAADGAVHLANTASVASSGQNAPFVAVNDGIARLDMI